MDIGHLDISKSPNGLTLAKGSFRTLQLGLTFQLQPILGDRKENAPTHAVVVKSLDGGDVQCGAAWLKTIERGELQGEPFFSISIDDPSLDRAFHCNAFPRARRAERLTICWDRPRRPQAGSALNPPAPSNGADSRDDLSH